MRAELPWNVAGIPPEAREAARAAARREGLSVGEWLTRRILRSFSDMGEDPSPMSLDPWGLPASAGASRRDTEEMLAHVSRSETEAGDVYRRIEDQLRGVARRLDSAERSQSENNRAITKTATEINIAAREQAQAFDQLGAHVVGLTDRLARVECNAANDGLKDAVKGLHQGLSRVADQITQTANQSATQVSALAGNLEQLASRLGQARHDAESTNQALDQRLAAVEKQVSALAGNLEQLASHLGQARHDAESANQALDQRLAAVEKNAGVNADLLEQALGKIEARASNQAAEQVEVQRRHAETEGHIERLSDAVATMQTRAPDAALARRLEGIEHTLGEIVSRLENSPTGKVIEDQLRHLSTRIDAVEKGEADPAWAPDPVPTPSFDAPPPYPANPPPFDAPSGKGAFAADPFEPVQDFVDPFAPAEGAAASGENFLANARRSARAAANKDEAERSAHGFNWGKPSQDARASTPRPLYLVAGAVALIIVLALVAGTLLSQRMRSSQPSGGLAGMFPSKSTAPATQAAASPAAPAPHVAPPSARPAKPPSGVQPLQTPVVQPAPINIVPTPSISPPASQIAPLPASPSQPSAANTPKAAPVDRLTTLANANNAVAETIVGLKYIDGDGVPSDPAQAAKWLERAANQGQPIAQYRLGTLYERGQGVGADPAKAVHWYEASANQGNRKAMHNLAVAYAEGSTGQKDMTEAARWFSKAANLGLTDSQFNLAVLYERGEGVPQSLIDAYKWYAIAAAQGDPESKQRLTMLQAQLSDDDKAAAQRSATSFHSAPLNGAANVPPDMGNLPAN